MDILVTGGAGYVGSTICSALIDAGHTPIILDSLINGLAEFTDGRCFYKGDIADTALLDRIFSERPRISCVIHCAALVSVPESVEKPYEYYLENVSKPLVMLKKLAELGCKRVIFSSTAALYGDTDDFLVTEESPLNPRSPYARTKYMLEMILEDFCAAYGINAIILRYFNLVGADPKFRSGPYKKSPSHLLGKIISAVNSGGKFMMTGTDWPTRDGTGIRDYFHVWDVARAHVIAAERFDSVAGGGYEVINLSSGQGVTVREFIEAFEKVTGAELPKEDAPPRPGDIPGAFASRDKAERLLGWRAELSLEQAISDSLEWDEIFRSRRSWNGKIYEDRLYWGCYLTDFIELAKSRKSIRDFKTDDIPDNLIMKLIEAAQAAPSAGNCQPWHFYIVKNKDVIKKIRAESCKQDFIVDAPVLLVVCADIEMSESRYKGRGKGLYYIQDTAAAVQNILLCVEDLGLGACWCGHFSEKKLSDILGLKDGIRPLAVLPVGYAKKNGTNTSRRPLDEIYTFIR